MLRSYSGTKASEQQQQQQQQKVCTVSQNCFEDFKTADKAFWALPQTAACAHRLGKLLGSTKRTVWEVRRIAALPRPDRRRLCWPVGTHRAITQATRLPVNHGKPLLGCVRRGVGAAGNTGGSGFKSPDWAEYKRRPGLIMTRAL